ncbi:MAG: hypothetical protein AAF738_02360 [Bacteroidota bacterium]
MKKSILLLTFLTSCLQITWAQLRLSSDSGLVFNGYNDVRAPSGDSPNRGTLFSLTDDFEPQQPIAFLRLQAAYTFSDKHTLELTAQPVRFDYEKTTNDAIISFEGVNFSTRTSPIIGRYEFDTYRFSYRYGFIRKEKTNLQIGLTVLLRDAKIALTQGDITAENTDLGFVPLVSFLFKTTLSPRLDFRLAGDALVGPQGRAEDVFAGLEYAIIPDRFFLNAGYRIVEGGADVDQVYSFALFHIASIGIASQF